MIIERISLKILEIRHQIRILIKYMIAAAVPEIWRKNERPLPMDMGKINPQAKNMSALAMAVNEILSRKKKLAISAAIEMIKNK